MSRRPHGGRTGTWLGTVVAAPSVDNTQPWQFRVYDGGIDVRVDPARRLRSFWPVVLGILKSLVWPALLVYQMLKLSAT